MTRLLRFVLSGAAAAAVDLLMLIALHGGLGLPLPWAVVIAYLAAFGFNFTVNRRWVFRGGSAALGGSMLRYLLLVAANLAANALLVPAIAGAGVDYRAAKAVVLVALFGVNYLVQRRWVFGVAGSVRSAASTPR